MLHRKFISTVLFFTMINTYPLADAKTKFGEKLKEGFEEIGEFARKPRCVVKKKKKFDANELAKKVTSRFFVITREDQKPLVNAIKKLNGSFSPKVEYCLNLHHMGITDINQIDKAIETAGLDPKNITKLNLARNFLTTIPSGYFTQERFPNLNTIILGSNCIKTVASEAFSNLPNLEVLFLGDNLIDIIPTDAIVNCPKLKLVTLGLNGIQKKAAKNLESSINAQAGREYNVHVRLTGINRTVLIDLIIIGVAVIVLALAIVLISTIAVPAAAGGAAVVAGEASAEAIAAAIESAGLLETGGAAGAEAFAAEAPFQWASTILSAAEEGSPKIVQLATQIFAAAAA
jgi:hypothetical protein